MPRLPPFAEPGSYLRFFGSKLDFFTLQGEDSQLRFLRLGAREGPLKYHWDFGSVAAGARSAAKTFGDLELSPNHIAQVYLGVSYGARARFFLPMDERLLRWDDPTLDIQERDTGNIEYEDSPVDDPRYNFWLAPTENFVPAIDVENVLSHVSPARSINLQAFFLAALYQFEFVEPAGEPEIFDKLKRFQIPSRPVTFGGAI